MERINSLGKLSIVLSKLRTFTSPKWGMEQYPTPSDIAAEVLWHAHMKGHILDKKICDFGSGPGILGIGALLLGAREVHFIEKDHDAILLLYDNLRDLEIPFGNDLVGSFDSPQKAEYQGLKAGNEVGNETGNGNKPGSREGHGLAPSHIVSGIDTETQEDIDLILYGKEKKKATIFHLDVREVGQQYDLILENPPFGTKTAHADKIFLEKAIDCSPLIYSFHKTSTEHFVVACSKSHDFHISEKMDFRFPLKKAHHFHKKKVEHIEVSCYILEKN